MDSTSMRGLIAGAVLLASAAAQANSYTIVDLGKFRFPTQIGDDGQIAIQRIYGNNTEAPVAWRGTHWVRLAARGTALAIDSNDEIGGKMSGAPVVWGAFGKPHLLSLPKHRSRGEVTGLSNGVAIGTYGIGGGYARCFTGSTSGGKATDIGVLGAGTQCHAHAINAAGHAVGDSTPRGGRYSPYHAFLWKDGKMDDLGTLPDFENSWAMAINNAEEVAGWSDAADGRAHATLWKDGEIIDLDASNSYDISEALSINDEGQSVGIAIDSQGGQYAVRFAGGAPIDLATEVTNLEGWGLTDAVSINNSGVIVGWGGYHVQLHGFMLVPQGRR